MNFKISQISLLLLSVVGCNTTNSVMPSKYEMVYSITIKESKHSSIYEILKKEFNDFPSENSKKINYKRNTENYSLQIILKKNYFKMKYISNKEYNDKINSIKSKIENIVK